MKALERRKAEGLCTRVEVCFGLQQNLPVSLPGRGASQDRRHLGTPRLFWIYQGIAGVPTSDDYLATILKTLTKILLKSVKA